MGLQLGALGGVECDVGLVLLDGRFVAEEWSDTISRAPTLGHSALPLWCRLCNAALT